MGFQKTGSDHGGVLDQERDPHSSTTCLHWGQQSVSLPFLPGGPLGPDRFSSLGLSELTQSMCDAAWLGQEPWAVAGPSPGHDCVDKSTAFRKKSPVSFLSSPPGEFT